MLVALGAGLLIGVERERRMKDEKTPAAAGVRTFAITALLGALAALSNSVVLLAATALGVITFTALSYTKSHDADPGLTTEIALLATFVTGVLAASQPVLAAAAGVIIVVLLVSRSALHSFAQRELSDQECAMPCCWCRGHSRAADTAQRSHRSWHVVNPRLSGSSRCSSCWSMPPGTWRTPGRRACRTADLRVVRRLRLEHRRRGHHGQACQGDRRYCRRRSPERRCRMSPPSCSSP